MSSTPERKLHKIAKVLEHERDRRVATLLTAAQLEEQAARQYQQAIEREACAREARSGSLPGWRAADWEQDAAWRMYLSKLREDAAMRHEQARATVQTARESLRESHSRVRRIEALLDRMAESRRLEEARLERKAEDEWVAANTAASRDTSD